MNSLEKINTFKDALVRTDEEFDGILGAVQGFVAMAQLTGSDPIADELGGKTADDLDADLLNIAGFVLWLRSDDAPVPDVAELTANMPAELAELIKAFGIA